MKKILTLLFLHLSFFSFAQFSFGIKGGLNISNVAFKDVPDGFYFEDSKADPGFHLGVYGKMKLTDKLFLIPELQFSRRGFVSEFFTQLNEETRISLNYVELPLLVSYAPIKWLAIDLGPDAAYMISAVSKTNGSSNNIADLYDDQRLDFGLTGGVRFNVTEKISIIGRYYYGLKSLDEIEFRDDNNNSTGTMKTYNRSAQFGVSYQLKK